MNPNIVTAPTENAVSLPNVKSHLRVDITDDDEYIVGLISSAVKYCEGISQTKFVTQTLDWTLDSWPDANGFYLPVGPVQSVTSISYTDEDGNAGTVSSSDYIVDTARGMVALKASADWPSVTLRKIAGVVIRYVAGYGNSRAVPAEIKQAILLVLGDWYENRENMIVGTVSNSVEINVRSLISIRRGFYR